MVIQIPSYVQIQHTHTHTHIYIYIYYSYIYIYIFYSYIYIYIYTYKILNGAGTCGQDVLLSLIRIMHHKGPGFQIVPAAQGDPHVWILKYGSGDIEALVTTDFVSVGSYTARMSLGNWKAMEG